MDEQLIRRAARGDAEAFDALARDRIDRLYAIAVRILRDHHDAEDAVQQALWTAWADLPGLRDPSRFDAWLYRLLVRLCYKAGRSRRRRSAVVRFASDLESLPDATGSDAVADRDELDRAFATLSTEHRAVMVLHHYLGLGLDEVAAVREIPHGPRGRGRTMRWVRPWTCVWPTTRSPSISRWSARPRARGRTPAISRAARSGRADGHRARSTTTWPYPRASAGRLA